MHGADDRGDGFTLFAGDRIANRSLEHTSRFGFPDKPRSSLTVIVIHAAALGTIASLITAPSGMSPVSTYRHRATASLRASATTMIRRMRGDCPAALASYQRDSELPL